METFGLRFLFCELIETVKKQQPIVTAAELSILELLWDEGAATKREIMLALYLTATDSDRATVQKLLERLESKGHVVRDRANHAHIFRPTMSQTAFAGAQLATMAEKVSGGTLLPLVLHLVETKKLNSRERAKLRKILEKSSQK